ncbi:MAG: hypothetical protein J07HX64_00775 [halophilic archaeon J07HX64]|nr:MAG: hypothetical protein J07HX64_00775 [halophilic archaeon J07HX64]
MTAPVEPAVLARAVRGESDGDTRVAVAADEPGPAHEYVGCIRRGMGLRTRTALAAAARSRGFETPHDPALTVARERVAALTDEDRGESSAAERERLRRAAAEAAGESERLRETVAAARGRLQARREQGVDPTQARTALAEAIERLSEAETEAAAARQRLDTVRKQAREHRDRREERFRAEERVANLERQARAYLREQVEAEYVTALDVVPGSGETAEPFEADPVTRALAVARVADLSAPVVLACERFESARAAADWLDTPVIRSTGPGR